MVVSFPCGGQLFRAALARSVRSLTQEPNLSPRTKPFPLFESRSLLWSSINWGTDEQTDTVTPPKSDDHDRSNGDPVVIEAPTVEAAEEAATQPAEETQAGVRDPVEQLNDLKTRIDALMKGGPGQTNED
jgi:hypothetical protein